MKKESGGKKGWLWLVLGLVAVIAVAVVIFVLPSGGKVDANKLYWNVDRGADRKPSADGTYKILFTCNGEQIEVTVTDKKMVGYIDTMDVMNLTLDKKGVLAEVKQPKEVSTVFGETLYIQQITEDAITFNTDELMKGDKVTVKVTDQLKAFKVTGTGRTCGLQMDLKKLQPMSTVSVYGTLPAEGEESVATHIFVSDHQEKGSVYWRTKKHYDSTNKTTIRVPDEDGVYTASFYCDGEVVDVKFKDKDLVTKIDSRTTSTCHFSFVFDNAGYVVEVVDSGKGSQSLLQCERYDITEIKDDGSYTAAEIIKYHGSRTVQGKIDENCRIYDVSSVAKAEKEVNRELDTLRVGDRLCIWTDPMGNPVLIYVTARRVDSPAYYNPDPQYDTVNKKTNRKPNEKGLYEIELLKAGETQLQTYYVSDVSMLNSIDTNADHCVGLKVSEGNIIEAVYDLESVFGQTNFCRGAKVTKVSKTQITANKQKGTLAEDCRIWNVSGTGTFGEETELQVGDIIYAGRNPDSEIVNIYVISRGNK